MENQITGTAGGAAEPRYVGFWLRVVAAIVDSIWAGIIIAIVVVLVFGDDLAELARMDIEASPEAAAEALALYGSLSLTEMLLFAVLIVAFWIWKSATPGKMLISAEIVDAKSLGKMGVGQSIVRYIGYIVSTIPLCLGFLWVAFDRRKQGWHDKIAGTLVVKK